MTRPAPVVLGGRLVRLVRLEPLTADHVPGLAAAGAGNRSSFVFTHVPDGVESAAEYVRQASEDAGRGWALPFATVLAHSGRVVGSTRFLDLGYWDDGRPRPPDVPVVAEIGWTWLAPDVQGTGANTEAKLLMLTHAFEEWRARRVSLKTDARNERSRAAIERLGARYDGTLRCHMPAFGPGGGPRDSAFFSIVHQEWPEVKSHLETRLRSY